MKSCSTSENLSTKEEIPLAKHFEIENVMQTKTPNKVQPANTSSQDSPTQKFQCNQCPCKYKRSNDLYKHLKLKHSINAQKLTDYLSKSEHQEDDESDHQMNESRFSHVLPVEEENTEDNSYYNETEEKANKNYECPYCTYFSNGNDTEYLLHIREHLGGKSFRCVLCNSVYKYRGDCVVHLKRKHQKPDMFAQNYVEKFLLDNVDIGDICGLLKPKQNEEVENEEKLFACAYCDYKANYKGDVFKHQTRRHPGSVKNAISLNPSLNSSATNENSFSNFEELSSISFSRKPNTAPALSNPLQQQQQQQQQNQQQQQQQNKQQKTTRPAPEFKLEYEENGSINNESIEEDSTEMVEYNEEADLNEENGISFLSFYPLTLY